MGLLRVCFGRVCFSVAFIALSPVAQPILDEQAICTEIQGYVNLLVDYTKTACSPAGGSEGAFSFVVLSSEPIFSVEATRKPWLLAVVLSIGKAMNDQPDTKPGELYLADAKARVAYFLPINIAKSLQNAVGTGQMKLGAMYKEIQKNLGRKELPGP
jgi:hypothetical protein